VAEKIRVTGRRCIQPGLITWLNAGGESTGAGLEVPQSLNFDL